MMAARTVHEADCGVIELCAARGEDDISARKLERWRQAGCLPRRVPVHRPGLRGSTTVNSDRYVDQVIAVAHALRSGVLLRNVPVALFMDGYEIEPDVLKRVYLDLFSDVRALVAKSIEAAGGGLDDPLDVADLLTRIGLEHVGGSQLAPFKRRARELAAKSGKPRRTEAQHLLVAATSVMFSALWAGAAPTPEGARTLAEVAGLADGQDFELEAESLGEASFDLLEAAVREATPEQWVNARRAVDQLYRYARARKQLDELTLPPKERLTGLEMLIAVDTPFARGCLMPQQLLHPSDSNALDLQETVVIAAEASSRLAAALPAELRRYFPDCKRAGIDREDPSFRERFVSAVQDWAMANPDDARVLEWKE
jgi:hypothetical protein